MLHVGTIFELSKRRRMPLYLTLRFLNLIVELLFTGDFDLHMSFWTPLDASLIVHSCMVHE